MVVLTLPPLASGWGRRMRRRPSGLLHAVCARGLPSMATLRLSAVEPTDVLLLDLDKNLPIRSVAIDGKPLAQTAWSNPDGRLRIRLPQPLAKGGSVSTTIAYGGQPHVAKRAPWG